MAVLVPSLAECGALVEPLNDGERIVARRLAEADDGWTVYVQPRIGMHLPDFVAVHPERAVCVIEVKDWSHGCYRNDGGRLEHRSPGGWRRVVEHPCQQAARYRDVIFDEHMALPDDGIPVPPSVRAVVVVLNHTTKQARDLLRSKQWRDVDVVGQDALADLDQTLTGPCPAPLRPPALARVTTSLEDGTAALHHLHAEQPLSAGARDVATNPRHARTRRVRGAAGTGKSVGLAARAARLAAEGRSVLVVSFNVTLAHYLRALVARACRGVGTSRVECTHFHGFCHTIVDEARARGIDAGPPIDGASSEGVIRRAEAVTDAGFVRPYDAILVDEGQDFRPEYWDLLRRHLRPGGEMLLVVDHVQNIHGVPRWTDAAMTGAGFSGPWTELDGSYRVPDDMVPALSYFASTYLAADSCLPTRTGVRCLPTARRWRNVDERDLVAAIVDAVVSTIGDTDNVSRPNEVTYLCDTHKTGLAVARRLEALGHDVHHVFATSRAERQRRKHRFWPDAPGIRGCTVDSFKGWESRVLVIGIGASKGDATWTHRRAYVSLTRLKAVPGHRSVVTVVNANTALRDFRQIFEVGVPLAPPQLLTTA